MPSSPVPLLPIQRLLHGLSLLGEECRVSGKHEACASIAHDIPKSFGPEALEGGGVFQNLSDTLVRLYRDSAGDACGTVEGIVALASQVPHDLAVFRGDLPLCQSCGLVCYLEPLLYRHRLMSVYGIRLEVVWESSEEQLVERTSLFDIEVVLDLRISPVREVLRMIVDLPARQHGVEVDSYEDSAKQE